MIQRRRNLFIFIIIPVISWFMLSPSDSYEEPLIEEQTPTSTATPTATPPVSTPTIVVTPEPTIAPTVDPTVEATATPTVVPVEPTIIIVPTVFPPQEGVCFCKVDDANVPCPTCKCHNVNQCIP